MIIYYQLLNIRVTANFFERKTMFILDKSITFIHITPVILQ